jgi:hypothetical protein
MEHTKESLTLELAPWQIRMAMDNLPEKYKKITRVSISIRIDPNSIRTYRVPNLPIAKDHWSLYLTDEQMKIVKENFKTTLNPVRVMINDASLNSAHIQFH